MQYKTKIMLNYTYLTWQKKSYDKNNNNNKNNVHCNMATRNSNKM